METTNSASLSISTSTSPLWTPSSWRKFPVRQQIEYSNPEYANEIITRIQNLPPLVSVREIEHLRQELAEVAEGKRFLLQGGDCAERFQDCQPDVIEKKLRIMLQMSLVLVWGLRMPTVRVARMAGQFAKPRSNDSEIVNGVQVPVFRGENINGFDISERQPDPKRLLDGYFYSAATLNFGRVLLADGFGDIHDAEKWELGFVSNSKRRKEYQEMVEQVKDSLDFVHTCGVGYNNHLSTIDLFVSHEGLGLAYEEAMTRKVNDKYYNMGTGFLWIGDRTRQLDHGHVEYFRGIENPIGIKVGPTMKPDELVQLIRILWPNPELSPGKITIITRYGDPKFQDILPQHIKAVQEAGFKVVWSCDPCHGNTVVTDNGYKTRDFEKILNELKGTLKIHQDMGSILGGVHFEMTGENVTECVGGPENLTEEDLPQQYKTYCDPRLNYAQSMEVAFLLAKLLKPQSENAPYGIHTSKRPLEVDDSSAY